MDNRLPNLVNLNEDPQLSEMLLYMLKEGKIISIAHKAQLKYPMITSLLLLNRHIPRSTFKVEGPCMSPSKIFFDCGLSPFSESGQLLQTSIFTGRHELQLALY